MSNSIYKSGAGFVNELTTHNQSSSSDKTNELIKLKKDYHQMMRNELMKKQRGKHNDSIGFEQQ